MPTFELTHGSEPVPNDPRDLPPRELLRIECQAQWYSGDTDASYARKLALGILVVAGHGIAETQRPERPEAIYVKDSAEPWILTGPPEPQSCERGNCHHQECARERITAKRAAARAKTQEAS